MVNVDLGPAGYTEQRSRITTPATALTLTVMPLRNEVVLVVHQSDDGKNCRDIRPRQSITPLNNKTITSSLWCVNEDYTQGSVTRDIFALFQGA